MEKRILQVRKLSDALRVRLKELKKSDADLLLNLDEEELPESSRELDCILPVR